MTPPKLDGMTYLPSSLVLKKPFTSKVSSQEETTILWL
jgi:hypothetical protein